MGRKAHFTIILMTLVLQPCDFVVVFLHDGDVCHDACRDVVMMLAMMLMMHLTPSMTILYIMTCFCHTA